MGIMGVKGRVDANESIGVSHGAGSTSLHPPLDVLGGSSCRVKNNRKGGKRTGFERHQIKILSMDMCSTR